MFNSLLNQAQKLFGRGFLLASFVPVLIFALSVAYLVYGFGFLENLARDWAKRGWREEPFEILLALVALYLVAYLLYGVRAAIHDLYQGKWPAPLRYLTPISLRRATRAFRRSKRREHEREIALNFPAWAIIEGFAPMNADVLPVPARDRQSLSDLSDLHNRLLQRPVAASELTTKEDEAYWDLLRTVCILQAHQDRFPHLASEIKTLASSLKDAYEKSLPLRESVKRFSDIARREWTEATNHFIDNFPPDESWLRPTRLGNMVSVLESYSLTRYGINLSELWPRLLHVVSDDVQQRVEDATIYLDFTVLTSFLMFATGIAGAIELLFTPPRHAGVHIVVTASFFLAWWLLYRLAIQATRSLNLQIQAAVDLFRLDLLSAMHIWFPNDPEEESNVWTEIRRFIAQGELPLNITFNPETKSPLSTAEKKGQQETSTAGQSPSNGHD